MFCLPKDRIIAKVVAAAVLIMTLPMLAADPQLAENGVKDVVLVVIGSAATFLFASNCPHHSE